jgi:hypothetical protein
MILQNMQTGASMSIDMPFTHEMVADFSQLGIKSSLVSLAFLEKPWSVDGKPKLAEAFHREQAFETKIARLTNMHFYPIPYAGIDDNDKFVLVIAREDDCAIEAIDIVMDDVRKSLIGYWFIAGVRDDLQSFFDKETVQ